MEAALDSFEHVPQCQSRPGIGWVSPLSGHHWFVAQGWTEEIGRKAVNQSLEEVDVWLSGGRQSFIYVCVALLIYSCI